MTFDFAPDWLDTLSATGDTAAIPFPGAPAPAPLSAAPAAVPLRIPNHPTRDEMALLVGELFAEGSLSFEQLCSLSNAPELEDLLDGAVAAVAPARRVAGGRR